MARPTFTPAQRKLQDEMLAKFEQGSRREVRQTLNSLKGQFRKALHGTVKALRSETDGRKARKLGREASETRKMLQTIENVKRRIKTITAGEAKRLGTQKARTKKLIAADEAKAAPAVPEATQAPATEAAPVAPTVAEVKEAVATATAEVVAQMTAALQPS